MLVDTGPLVALIRKVGSNHDRCRQFADGISTPLLTTWPVLTEAAWLLRFRDREVRSLIEMVHGGFVSVDPLDPNAAKWILGFMETYRDQSPQLADATLMYLAEELDLDDIFTLDRRDFSVFRKRNGDVLRIHPD